MKNKKILSAAVITSLLFAATAVSAANLETRTYGDDSDELFYKTSISNVVWDSSEPVKETVEEYCQRIGRDFNDKDNVPFFLREKQGWEQLPLYMKLRQTTDEYKLYITAVAPCILEFSEGGTPIIGKVTGIEYDSWGEKHYKNDEKIEINDNTVTLNEGKYYGNNYSEDALTAEGFAYYYNYVIDVVSPYNAFNADAYVKVIKQQEDFYTHETQKTSYVAFEDQPPVIRNERTLVPMRDIFETLGAEIEWNDETKSVTATKDETVISIAIDDNALIKNGETIPLDTPATIINDRTMVPMRAISEAFNYEVQWDDSTKTATIIMQ